MTSCALAQAIPDKVPAAFFGTIGVVAISGTHPRSQNYYVGVFPYPGGYGASRASDGLINGTPPQSMANFMSLEMSEHRFPVRFYHFSVREDSGGAGWHRGGLGPWWCRLGGGVAFGWLRGIAVVDSMALDAGL